MFDEMWYTPVHIDGAYVGRFLNWGKEYNDDTNRNYTIVLYITDEGLLKGRDYNMGVSFPDLAKNIYLNG